MNIVHVLPSLARGGGERLAIDLANRQVDAGHSVALIVGGALPAERIHEGLDTRVTLHHVSQLAGRGRYAAMLPWIWRNRRWLGAQDILHCHLTYGAVFATAFMRMTGRVRRPAIVETYHAVGMPIPRLVRWLHARLASQWDGLTFMVEDPYWARFIEGRPIVSEVIPAGVDPPDVGKVSAVERSAYRSEHGIPEDALVVTSIGRLVAERRPRSSLPVFAGMAKSLERDVHFLIGGDGPERQSMEADAKGLGISDRVHFTGLVRHMEQPLAVSDLYVTANVGPVPGVAGLQAVAAGVPTLAVQLREDYPSGSADWIWSSRDPVALAKRGSEILADPVAAAALVQLQNQHLEAHHSGAAMAAAYDRFYGKAIAARGSRRLGRQ